MLPNASEIGPLMANTAMEFIAGLDLSAKHNTIGHVEPLNGCGARIAAPPRHLSVIKTAYQFEPRAMATDFDDSKWETVEGKDLGARAAPAMSPFLWYRALLTMPAQVGSVDLSKPTQAVLNVLVDDYGEVWV